MEEKREKKPAFLEGGIPAQEPEAEEIPLFEALNSTGKVTSWNTTAANKIKIDNFIYPVNPPIKDTIKPKYPRYEIKFTTGTNADRILKNVYPSLS